MYNQPMKNLRQSHVNIHRDAWVEINLESLAHNVKEIKRCMPDNMDFLAVVKADAYGHGAVMCTPIMLASGVSMLGVASVDEGLDLREANIKSDILVLGVVPNWAFEVASKNDISVSIFTEEHIIACKEAFQRTGKKIKAHIKLDTGMNRIGIDKNNAVEFIKKVSNLDYIDLKGIFTHLANAESIEKTENQFKIWESIISSVNTDNLLLHILNTAGCFSYSVKSNMARAGIALYGLYPDLPDKKDIRYPKLKQIIGLKGRITRIHTMQEGEGISYGHTFIANKDIKVATIPIGYADGVPRILSNKIYGMLNNKKIKQIGNITMDQMMFDISNIDAEEGDIITLLDDKELLVDEWAKIADTINYELICRLKVRLPRVYVR